MNKNYELVKTKDEVIAVYSEKQVGSKFVAIRARETQFSKKENNFVAVGSVVEAFGGFKNQEDFDYDTARKVTLENAVSKIQASRVI